MHAHYAAPVRVNEAWSDNEAGAVDDLLACPHYNESIPALPPCGPHATLC